MNIAKFLLSLNFVFCIRLSCCYFIAGAVFCFCCCRMRKMSASSIRSHLLHISIHPTHLIYIKKIILLSSESFIKIRKKLLRYGRTQRTSRRYMRVEDANLSREFLPLIPMFLWAENPLNWEIFQIEKFTNRAKKNRFFFGIWICFDSAFIS